MNNLIIQWDYATVDNIDPIARELFGSRISGVSYDGSNLAVHFIEDFGPSDTVAFYQKLALFDPVLISAVRHNGTATLVFTKPFNLDAITEITPTVDGQPFPNPVVLGEAVEVESFREITIGIIEDYPHTVVTV